ncbi:MAG: protein-methionine-sulfoxide reductase catalytic subunit MsrP, partial [Acidobacteriota bacterium]
MLIRKRRGWEIPERQVTPEGVYMNRRQALRSMGFAGVGMGSLLAGCSWAKEIFSQGVKPVPEAVRFPEWPAADLYPADRNPGYSEEATGRSITPPAISLAYNNYYEFFTDKSEVWKLVEQFETRPWEIEVSGLVENPQKFDVDELVRSMPIEERVYRFRCVEAWAATIPWAGFPFKALIDKVQPKSRARFVRMVTVKRPSQMPGIPKQPWYPWPYHEALTIPEAMNELAMLVTGAYGKPLPKQNGAPIRLITPWKFGFKNIKSIVKIEFTEKQPKTLWSDVAGNEYGFWANVNPKV